MAKLDLNAFPQVWVADAEFRPRAGEPPDVHCLVLREWRSEKTIRLWRDQLARMRAPPHPVGPGSLFVSYSAMAELTCYLALGWELPCRVLDLLVEFRWLTNGTGWREDSPHKHRLIEAAAYFGMDPMDAAEKAGMQELGKRGGPFTDRERRDLVDYCERDVVVTAGLLTRMAPRLVLQALQRGRFIRSAARTQHA